MKSFQVTLRCQLADSEKRFVDSCVGHFGVELAALVTLASNQPRRRAGGVLSRLPARPRRSSLFSHKFTVLANSRQLSSAAAVLCTV